MIAQKLIFSYSSRIFIQFVQVLASIIVARFAGPTVLGTVAFGLAYVNVFSPIADLGFTTAYMKKLSEGDSPEVCLGTFVRIKLILLFLYFLAVLGFYLFQKFIAGVQFESPIHETVILVQLLAATVGLFYSIPRATFAARTEIAKSDIPNFIMSLLHQILRVVIVFLGFGAVMLSGANLLSTIMVGPVFYYFFKGNRIGTFDSELAKKYFRIASPVMLTAVFSGFITSIDVLLLQFFTNSEQTGYYTAGFRVGGFVLLISQSVGGIFFPIFSNLISKREYQTIDMMVKKFERFTYIFIMPFVIFTTIFSYEVVTILLGKDYTSSASIMVLINITMFLKIVNTANASILSGLGYFKQILYIEVLYLIVFVSFITLFVSRDLLNLSGFGVALAMMFSQILSVILHRILTNKALPVISNITTIKFLSFGTTFTVAVFYIKSIIFSPVLVYYLLAPIVIFGSFYGILYILNFLERSDLNLLRQIIDMRSMKSYVKTEVFRNNDES